MEETKVKNFGSWCRERIVEELATKFRDNANLFVTEFSSLKVNDLEELRKRLKKDAGVFVIVKNSLACLAFKKTNLDYLSPLLGGQTGIILGGDNPVSVSRTLAEFSKKFSSFKIKGGLFNAQPLTIEQVRQLSLLPPRPVLLGRVCGGLKSSLSRLVYSLGLLNKLVLVIKNRENQIKSG